MDPYMPDAMKLISAQKDAAIAALNLAVKVDENHFRKRSASALLGILERLAEADQKKLN